MTNIEMTTATCAIAATLAVPEGTGPRPGVVVVHDAFGLSEDIRRNTQRFADNGILAIAPDLFSRGTYVRCVRTVLRSMAQRTGEAVDDLLAARGSRLAVYSPTGKTAPGRLESPDSAWAVASHLSWAPKGLMRQHPSIRQSFETSVSSLRALVLWWRATARRTH